MKKVLLLLALIICPGIVENELFAQTTFKSGYYVDLAGDTIRAEIEYIDYLGSIETVRVKKSGKDQSMYPHEIKGFGYPGDRFYRAGIKPDVFLELIVDGKLSLLRERFTYYFTKEGDTAVYQIENNREVVKGDGQTFERQETKWKGLVYYLISDCNPSNISASQIGITENYLRKTVIKYNECAGSNYRVYKQALPEATLSFGLNGGVIFQTQELFFYGREKIEDNKVTDLFFGATMDLYLPKFSNRLHLLVEVNYFQGSSSFYSYYGNNGYRRNWSIETAGIQIPVLIQYRIDFDNWYLGINGGVGSHIYTKILLTQFNERLIDEEWVEIFRLEDKEFESTGEFQAYGGLSIAREVGNVETGLTIRYNHQLNSRVKNEGYFTINGLQLGGFIKF